MILRYRKLSIASCKVKQKLPNLYLDVLTVENCLELEATKSINFLEFVCWKKQ